MPDSISNRKAWLLAGAERMAPWFPAVGGNEVPPIRVSCPCGAEMELA
jgi:hypothetical protein